MDCRWGQGRFEFAVGGNETQVEGREHAQTKVVKAGDIKTRSQVPKVKRGVFKNFGVFHHNHSPENKNSLPFYWQLVILYYIL